MSVLKFFFNLKPLGWVVTGATLIATLYGGYKVYRTVRQWHYDTFILPVVNERVLEYSKPLYKELEGLRGDTTALNEALRLQIQDNAICADNVGQLQLLTKQVTDERKELLAEVKRLKSQKNVDLLIVRQRSFGRVDSTFVKWWER
jgi:hypothetical protein